jgi:hypothetical protein
MAKMQMIKDSERFVAAVRYSEFRPLPSKDAQGLDYLKSIREVSPKNALETIIRHFTDTLEQKREQKELRDVASAQIRRAEEQSIKARDFSVAVDTILNDHCRAAGVSPRGIAPMLNSEEIAEVREFAETRSAFSTARKEFSDAARLGEQGLQQRQDAADLRESEQTRTQDQSARPREQSPSQPTP